MRICPVCQLALRLNDPSGWCDVPPDNEHFAKPGNYGGVCSDCCSIYRPEAERTPYLNFVISCDQAAYAGSGNQVSHGDLVRASQNKDGTLSDCPAGLCGICKRMAREDAKMYAIRIWREDLSEEEQSRLILPHNQAECYMACPECIEKYKPAVLARLKRLKIVPEELTVKQLGHFSLI